MRASDWLHRVRVNVIRERKIHDSKYKFGDLHSDRYHLGYSKALKFVEEIIDYELEVIEEREKKNEGD